MSTVEQKLLDEISLRRDEYELIVQRLGREPTRVELGMFGALWNEHCGYKHSKLLLRHFPTTGPRVLQGPGENAGAVDIGDGLAVVLKMESHNHPSAIEPFQGAATGVGGIIRDIFTMGARPIACLDSLRFGPLSEPRNRYLFGGVVGGIASYGNCIGVPTVGGEVHFAPSYSANCLVNVMAVGLVEHEHIVRSQASGAGNRLMLVGADTGRDGIMGASFASAELNERSEERRPAVQVGNPFLEKLLIEACLEVARTEHIVAMQDLGAAGITSSVVESAAKGGCGADIDVSRVSRREQGMTPYEVMLSESQERMLVVVKRGHEAQVKAIFDRWGLHSDIIGSLTDDALVRVRESGRVVAELPAKLLTEPPLYRTPGVRPAYLAELNGFDWRQLPEPTDYNHTLLQLLASPSIASKEHVYRQYDHQVQVNTVVAPGAADAAVLRVKGTSKAIAVTSDGNGRYCYLDAHRGGAIAVAEAARNLACVGAQPLAITDCLNFGNPEKGEIYYQLEQAILGMAEACRVLEVPVVSGNVSLYNETSGEAVYPTPVVGMVGLLEDVEQRCNAGFQSEGAILALLGGQGQPELGGSEYLEVVHGRVAGMPPAIDLELERRAQQTCLSAIRRGIIDSAHDCSDGGLAVALAESCILGGKGAVVSLAGSPGRWDGWLFGEGQSRILVSVAEDRYPELVKLAGELRVPLDVLGRVGGDRLRIASVVDLPLRDLERTWREAIAEKLRAPRL